MLTRFASLKVRGFVYICGVLEQNSISVLLKYCSVFLWAFANQFVRPSHIIDSGWFYLFFIPYFNLPTASQAGFVPLVLRIPSLSSEHWCLNQTSLALWTAFARFFLDDLSFVVSDLNLFDDDKVKNMALFRTWICDVNYWNATGTIPAEPFFLWKHFSAVFLMASLKDIF